MASLIHQSIIMEQCDRPHPVEMCFQLGGQSYDDDGLLDTGQTRIYGSGLAPGGQWQQGHKQPIISVSMHIEPELVTNFWGEDNRDITVNWQKLFRSAEQPYFVCSGSITPQMQMALQQILHCLYQGAIARMYLESKVWELMALQLAQMTEDIERQSKHSLKTEDRDRFNTRLGRLGRSLYHFNSFSGAKYSLWGAKSP